MGSSMPESRLLSVLINKRFTAARLLVSAVLLGFCALSAANAEPQFRLIEGGQGVPLAIMEMGEDESGTSILFLHGYGFSSEFWAPQLQAEALKSVRMVALDLRGHGASGKPWQREQLISTQVWADDVAAAIAAAKLDRPVLVGWSYGGYVAMDYIRHYGTENIAGLVLVASPAGLAPRLHPSGDSLPGGDAGYAEAARQRDSLSLRENLAGNRYLAELMTGAELPASVLDGWTAQMMRVPTYFTQALRQGRSLENADIRDKLELPVAIAVGAKDASMAFDQLEGLADDLAAGEYWYFESAGHAVSTDAADDFNSRLLEFARSAR